MNGDLTRQSQPEDLLPFFARRVALYAGMDHSSVPRELALELFASARFTLAEGPGDMADPEARFTAGLAATRRKIEYGKKLWQAVCGSLPQISSLSLRGTLKSIGDFFHRYDCRFFAHQIPCDIDYQLGLPVPDGLEGINYVNRYLSHLAVENDFLRRFDPHRASRLLRVCCGDYRGLLVNLFEPVAVNALALALAGGDVAGLSVGPEERAQVREAVRRDPQALERAAEKLCALLAVSSHDSLTYLTAVAAGLLPRVCETDLEGVFPSIP